MIAGVCTGKKQGYGGLFFHLLRGCKTGRQPPASTGNSLSPQAVAGACKNYLRKIWQIGGAILIFATHSNGTMAERLGIGLQNRVHRFESGWYLLKSCIFMWDFLILCELIACYVES